MATKHETDNYNHVFKESCKNDQLEVAKWLATNYKIDSQTYKFVFEVIFTEMCKISDPYLLIHPVESKITTACANNRLEIVKWLLTDYNFDVNIEDVFRKSCTFNIPQFANWLIIHHNIDVHADNEYEFKYSCRFGLIEIIKLFTQEHNYNNFKYAYHNETAYIINHPELEGWKSCTILDCPVIYYGVLDEQAVIQIMGKFKRYKSAR